MLRAGGRACISMQHVVTLHRDATLSCMQAFADTYFKQFQKTPFGMIRSDPQDMGPAYRNVRGLDLVAVAGQNMRCDRLQAVLAPVVPGRDWWHQSPMVS